MELKLTNREFRIIEHPIYPPNIDKNPRIVQESSAIGNYENSSKQPGSSYLWIGMYHHLNREEIAILIKCMQNWIDTGRLPESIT